MSKPRGLLSREEVVLLVVILCGIIVVTVLFILFRSTNELASAAGLAVDYEHLGRDGSAVSISQVGS